MEDELLLKVKQTLELGKGHCQTEFLVLSYNNTSLSPKLDPPNVYLKTILYLTTILLSRMALSYNRSRSRLLTDPV